VAAGKQKLSGRATDSKPPPKTRKTFSNKKKGVTKVERRDQILQAARDVFARVGYARATVDDVVKEAGVARGTFYLYFDDKRGALEELIDRFAIRIVAAIVHIGTDEKDAPVSEQVLQNIRGILGVCLGERVMTKILFTDAVGADPEFHSKLTHFYSGVVQLLTESLRDGQALGIVADGEPRVLAYMTIGALKELLYQAVTLGLSGESTEALTTQMYAFLRSGYLRERP
jgi:AcrR family transcriptional regulator